MFPIFKTEKELKELESKGIKFIVHGKGTYEDGTVFYNISFPGILT